MDAGCCLFGAGYDCKHSCSTFLRTATIAESKYKYHVSEKERAIEWPWKYKTPAEKYPVVKFNGKQFIAKSQNSIHTEVMGEIIGSCVAEGLDPDTGKTYTETFEVRKIKAYQRN